MSVKLKVMLLSVIFVMGYANLSYELIVLRQLVNFFGLKYIDYIDYYGLYYVVFIGWILFGICCSI